MLSGAGWFIRNLEIESWTRWEERKFSFFERNPETFIRFWLFSGLVLSNPSNSYETQNSLKINEGKIHFLLMEIFPCFKACTTISNPQFTFEACVGRCLIYEKLSFNKKTSDERFSHTSEHTSSKSTARFHPFDVALNTLWIFLFSFHFWMKNHLIKFRKKKHSHCADVSGISWIN